jgi:seryl-tRNA synthetase
MLDRKLFFNDSDAVVHSLGTRNKKWAHEAASLKSIVEHAAKNLRELEDLQAKLNAETRGLSALSSKDKANKLQELKLLSDIIAKHQITVNAAEETVVKTLATLPNIPLPDVPVGTDASENVTLREIGERRIIKSPKDYFTLATDLDIIDVKRAAKISGSRFGYLKGTGALLEFALIQYAMQTLTKAGYTAIVPPVIINEPYMEAMGYLAQGGEDEIYHLEKSKQFLVGTSEQSVGPYHANEILPINELPKKYVAFSTCFRREAGSYGKDTKGILRVHQFDKVEMFVVCGPEKSEEMHQELLALQENLVKGLGIPYRVMLLCTGDIGFPSAKTYDIECWLPGQNGGKGEYRETHSTSNTTDYQARALNIRVKDAGGKNRIVHLLNGTAFAIGRTIIAILENCQNSDGTIRIPDVLQPFMQGIKEIKK